MVSVVRTTPYIGLQFAALVAVGLLGVYLLCRHGFLIQGKLHPHDFGCWNWCRLLLSDITFGMYDPILYGGGEMIGPGNFVLDSSIERAVSPGSKNAVKMWRKKKKSVNRRSDRMILYFTIASCSLFTLVCLMTAVVMVGHDGFDWIPWIHGCKEVSIIVTAMYPCAKALMYLVFISRLESAFKGSIYEYPSWLIQSMYIAASVCGLGLSITAAATVKGRSIDIYKSTKKGSKVETAACHGTILVPVVIAMAVVDIVFTVTIACLFTRSLQKMFNAGGVTNKKIDASTVELRLLPLKYSVVSCVGVLSTLAGLTIYGITNALLVLSVDMGINIVCLLLMHSLWKPAFMVIFTPLMRCMVYNQPYWSELLDRSVESNNKQRLVANEHVLNQHIAKRILDQSTNQVAIETETCSISSLNFTIDSNNNNNNNNQ